MVKSSCGVDGWLRAWLLHHQIDPRNNNPLGPDSTLIFAASMQVVFRSSAVCTVLPVGSSDDNKRPTFLDTNMYPNIMVASTHVCRIIKLNFEFLLSIIRILLRIQYFPEIIIFYLKIFLLFQIFNIFENNS